MNEMSARNSSVLGDIDLDDANSVLPSSECCSTSQGKLKDHGEAFQGKPKLELGFFPILLICEIIYRAPTCAEQSCNTRN
jgi:hypothetical protein